MLGERPLDPVAEAEPVDDACGVAEQKAPFPAGFARAGDEQRRERYGREPDEAETREKQHQHQGAGERQREIEDHCAAACSLTRSAM